MATQTLDNLPNQGRLPQTKPTSGNLNKGLLTEIRFKFAFEDIIVMVDSEILNYTSSRKSTPITSTNRSWQFVSRLVENEWTKEKLCPGNKSKKERRLWKLPGLPPNLIWNWIGERCLFTLLTLASKKIKWYFGFIIAHCNPQ